MKIGIVGTRGIPAAYGGFETFVEEIATRLASTSNISVVVYCDKNSWSEDNYKGVKLRFISTTKSNSPILFYFLSVWLSVKESDIVLIAGSAGSLFYKLKFLLKRNVFIIVNTDGIEHKRSKWSFLKRNFVHFVENFAIKNSDLIVADSRAIKRYWEDRYPGLNKSKIITIEYGANVLLEAKADYLGEYNLVPDNYFLVVARLEPENNIHIIIEGYKKSKSQIPLIIVGSTSANTDYVSQLKVQLTAGVKFIGGVYEKDKLSSLRFYAKAYFHGHSVGGTNPSLLEAMGAGNLIIAHDNEFNREVTDNNAFFFKNSSECAMRIVEFDKLSINDLNQIKSIHKLRIQDYYNWERITSKYVQIFESIANLSKLSKEV